MLQVGPELGVIHGSLLLLPRLLLLPLGQHPRHLRTEHTHTHTHTVSSALTAVSSESNIKDGLLARCQGEKMRSCEAGSSFVFVFMGPGIGAELAV